MTTTEFTEEDRRLLKAMNEKLTHINGAVKRHDEEIFGDDTRGTPGLVKDVQMIKDTILTARAVIRTLWATAVFLGLTNIAAIVTLINGGN